MWLTVTSRAVLYGNFSQLLSASLCNERHNLLNPLTAFSGSILTEALNETKWRGYSTRVSFTGRNVQTLFFCFFFTCAYLMSASMADLSIPLTACAEGKAALFTLLQSSIFGAYPSVPAMANAQTVTLCQACANIQNSAPNPKHGSI